MLHVVSCAVLLLGCDKQEPHSSAPVPSAAATVAAPGTHGNREVPAPAGSRVGSEQQPVNLLVQATSAYTAKVIADVDGAYLMTEKAAYRLDAKGHPTEIRLDNGFSATTTATSIVFYEKGALVRQPKQGGKSERLASVSGRPENLTSSGDALAWSETPSKGSYVIQLLDPASQPRRLHAGKGKIWSIALGSDRVVFLEVLGNTWRIGEVSRDGGEPRFAVNGDGHAPSALVASDRIYFYEWKTKELRRISFSLSDEEVLVRGLDCRELAVGARVYCANETGFFEIVKQPNAQPTKIASGVNVTSLSASATRLVWVSDFASGKLSVDMLPLTAAAEH